MAKRRIRAGELGAIQITRLAAGSYRDRARPRDDAGTLRQLVIVANTEDAVRLALQRKVEALSASMFSGVTGANTIAEAEAEAEAAAARLEQVHARAIAGSLTFSTYESYETIVRCVLVPQCGGITLDALTVGRCDRIIQAIMLHRSVSAARRACVVLGQICGYPVRGDAIRYNPVRDVQRLPLAEKKTSILTPAQIASIRDLMQHWREMSTNGPRPDYRALIDGMDIMLRTSARVGDCIGLRRCDVEHDHRSADAPHRRDHRANEGGRDYPEELAQTHSPAPPGVASGAGCGRRPPPTRAGRQRQGRAAVRHEEREPDQRQQLLPVEVQDHIVTERGSGRTLAAIVHGLNEDFVPLPGKGRG